MCILVRRRLKRVRDPIRDKKPVARAKGLPVVRYTAPYNYAQASTWIIFRIFRMNMRFNDSIWREHCLVDAHFNHIDR